jgi:asparagine synthase (glutamine-hydrolysing)
MCGITGFWNIKRQIQITSPKEVIQKMADAIIHRGPDSSGLWWDEKAEIYFGHRRLAIIDLSSAGHQPMVSRSGLSVLSYNGEIYNSDELRKQLIAAGCQFKGYSDTEVILEACEHWGVEKTAQNLIGMFAFSFWDARTQQLALVRDRVGKKPLYWGIQQGVLLFASELKALTLHPCWSPQIDRQALSSYFDYNYVPAPSSIYQNIQKLRPGRILTIHASGKTEESIYWDFLQIAANSLISRDNRSESELQEALDVLLRDAVKRRMISDVPLAAFLSGGIDSSLIVALMQGESSRAVKTFSIGFHEAGYNEATYAAAVARHLGTDHHELYLHSEEAQSIIPQIPDWFDEPFADVSQIPTFLVSKLARQQVTVSLSGDGGDELFAGYNRYFFGNNLWNLLAKIPKPARSLLEKSLLSVSPMAWDKFAAKIPVLKKQGRLGDKIHKLSGLLSASNREEFYQLAISHWGNPHALVKGENSGIVSGRQGNDYSNFNFVEYMQYKDTLGYLPDDILTKVDRASMAVSLEARTPFLDHRVVEFAWTLPMNMKIRQGKGKWLLRSLLNRYVPINLIERPKMGFSVPIDAWLRGPLREWSEQLLSEHELRKDDILNPQPIRQRWQEHLSGKRNWQYSLWGVLMFQAWRSKWGVK